MAIRLDDFRQEAYRQTARPRSADNAVLLPKTIDDCVHRQVLLGETTYDLKRIFSLWGYNPPSTKTYPLLEYRTGFECNRDMRNAGASTTTVRLRKGIPKPDGNFGTDADVYLESTLKDGRKNAVHVEVIWGGNELSHRELLTVGGVPKWQVYLEHAKSEQDRKSPMPQEFWVFVAADKEDRNLSDETQALLGDAKEDLSAIGMDFRVKKSAYEWNGIREWPSDLHPHTLKEAQLLVQALNMGATHKGIRIRYDRPLGHGHILKPTIPPQSI